MTDVEGRHRLGQIGTVAKELNKLTEYPEWDVLRQEFAKAREAAERRMARDMFSGGEGAKPLDQRQVDYRRGFLRGVQAVLDAPGDADTAFKKAMERMTDSVS